MKKILFVIYGLGGGGAERVVVNLLKYINYDEFACALVLFKKEGPYLNELSPELKIYDLKKVNRYSVLKLIFKLSRIIKCYKPDIVLSFGYYANIITMITKFFASTSSKFCLSERTYTNKSLKDLSFSQIRMLLTKILYKNADLIIVNSKAIKNHLVRDFSISPNKIEVIQNPFDLTHIFKSCNEEVKQIWFKEKEKTPIIITVGRLSKEKNYSCLLNAFKLVREAKSARLVFIGDGKEKVFLENLAIKLGINENVAFLGFQKNPFKYISKSTVFVLPSLYEGFSNVLVEAMACGVPVISTNYLGVDEVITDGENGLLVPTGNVESMANAILTLLENEDLRKKFIEAGRKRANYFSAEKIVKEYQECFNFLTKCTGHIVLIGLNYLPKRATGDKNFFYELIPFLAKELERITIISIKNIDKKLEEYIDGKCHIIILYYPPKLLSSPDIEVRKIFWRKGAFPSSLGIVEKTLNAIRICKTLKKIYAENPYDHIHLMDNFGFINRLIAKYAPTDVSVSAMAYQGKNKFIYDKYLYLSYRHSNITVIPYSLKYEEKLRHIGIKQVKHIRWGVKLPPQIPTLENRKSAKKLLSLPDDNPLFLWAGYIQQIQKKDFLLAIKIAKQALEKGLNGIFYFAFKPEINEKKLCLFHSPEEGIYVGPTSIQEFELLKKAADIFYSPVINKNCILAPPLTWIEVMSVGMPILTTETDGVNEIVVEGKTGYIAKTEEELLEKIFAIQQNYKEMIPYCYNKASTSYNIQESAKNYINLWYPDGI